MYGSHFFPAKIGQDEEYHSSSDTNHSSSDRKDITYNLCGVWVHFPLPAVGFAEFAVFIKVEICTAQPCEVPIPNVFTLASYIDVL